MEIILFCRCFSSKIMGIATGYILMITGFLGLIALAARFHYHAAIIPEVVVTPDTN